MLSGVPRRSRCEMAVGGKALELAERDLLLEQLAGHADIARDENIEGELQVLHQPRVHVADLPKALGRELQLVTDLLVRQLHQVLVDDVADMLEVGGEGDDVDGAAAVLVASVSRLTSVR